MPRKGMRSIFSSPNRSQLSGSSFPSPSRSFTESLMAQILEQAELVISKWDEDSSGYAKITSLFYENRREARDFIKQVNDLHKAMHTLVTEKSSSQMLVRAQILMQMAMKRLQKEFYQILSTNQAYLDPESISTRSSVSTRSSSPTSIRSSTSDYGDDSEDEINQEADKLIMEVENASVAALTDLVLIAECMISSGYGKECVNTYKIMRKSIVDEGLYKLGVAEENASKIHKMDWEFLDLRIKNWLSAVNVVVNTLFRGERILCDQVFAASDTVRELCFNEITKEGATLMFKFPEIVVKNSKKSPEKIFRTLDMYTAIASNWPEIELIFSSESTSSIIEVALNSTTILRDSVQKALTEFEKSIQKESSKTPDAGAVVHSLTTDVMSFLPRLADYNVLQDILFDYTMPAISSLPESFYDTFDPDEYPTMEVSLHFAWLILVLLCKLDGKAKHHKDVSHSYLFLANNIQHITSKVRTSNLKYLIGDNWISKHEAKVATFATKYERLGWSHVIDSLPVNPTAVLSPEKAKESFKRFNFVFEEAHQKQSVCVIQDRKLRDDIKLSIANKLLPLYREFYNAHGIQLRREGRFAHVVRYTPEDLGHALSDLFFGSGSSSASFSDSTLVLPVASRP